INANAARPYRAKPNAVLAKGTMPNLKPLLLLSCLLALATMSTHAAEKKDSPLDKINWVKGPATASLKNQAEVKVPEGFMFTDSKGTQDLLHMMGNPTHGNELGFLAPTSMV